MGISTVTLSIIIVNYNCLDLVVNCLESFEEYAPSVDYEIIVVNNDSNVDLFFESLRNQKNVKLVQNTGNWGFSSGCNLGAQSAIGDYYLFLNPDTRLNDTRAIDQMIELMQSDNQIGACGCRTVTKRGIGNELSWTNPWLLIGWIRAIHGLIYCSKIDSLFAEDKDIWFPEFVGGSAIMFNASDFMKIGGWSADKFWMYCEDSDICYRIGRLLGKKVALIRNASINHISGGASKVDSNSKLMLKLELIISTHNYIYHNSNSISRFIILPLYILKSSVPTIIKLFISLLLYNRKKIRKYKYLTIGITKYYLSSISRRTWRSHKIDQQQIKD